jgi:hypothetical protein
VLSIRTTCEHSRIDRGMLLDRIHEFQVTDSFFISRPPQCSSWILESRQSE